MRWRVDVGVLSHEAVGAVGRCLAGGVSRCNYKAMAMLVSGATETGRIQTTEKARPEDQKTRGQRTRRPDDSQSAVGQ